MRLAFGILLAFFPSVAFAQTKEIDDAIKQKLATAKFVLALQAPTGGFYPTAPDPKAETKPVPSLRATSAAVRSLKYLGVDLPNKDKHAAFVLTCFDPKTGGFAESGGKSDVALTSVGVMAAVELGIPKEKHAKAMDYLKENAKTFEEVRIGAAAVEAWGVKDCPFDLKPWLKIADEHGMQKLTDVKTGGARETGSLVAMFLRLGEKLPPGHTVQEILQDGQRDDGGWAKSKEGSDPETTYRVMRAFMLLKEKPKDLGAVRKFVESHRNKDGGYATKPGDKSSISGVYFAVMISKWLGEMEKK